MREMTSSGRSRNAPPIFLQPYVHCRSRCRLFCAAMELTVESCVRGLHVYKDTWTPSVGEELPCKRETGNDKDRYAVAVMRGDTIVGHVPRKISAACSLFLRRNGTIRCTVTGSRRFSALDLQTPPTEDLNDITQKYWRILIWRFARKSAKPPN